MAAERLLYVGHATVLVETAGTRVLTDPLLTGRVAHIRRHVPVPEASALLPLAAILISHAHADHLHPASLKRLAGDRPVIAPRGCARILRRAGAREIIELRPGEDCTIGALRIEAVPARHDGRRQPLGRPIPALGYLIEGAVRIYFAGDTDLFDGMAALEGRVDVALLPVWGWGPRLPPGHLDPVSAARAVSLVRPSLAIPIHWGTVRSIGAPRATVSRAPAVAFAAAVAEMGLSSAVRILMPGESVGLDAVTAGSRGAVR